MLPPDETDVRDVPRFLPGIFGAGVALDGLLCIIISANGLGLDMETRTTATIATFGILVLAFVFIALCLTTKFKWPTAGLLTLMVLISALVAHSFAPIIQANAASTLKGIAVFVIIVLVAVALIAAIAIPILAPVWPSIWASAKDAAKYYRDEIAKSLRSEKKDG